ncbi:excitatory amino acid transporter 2 [Planococcus citri]|uniref:excitatory amino acid transporter 2 n=1 Tax=Planococcus citri TaxID=170843 RepID=UPI0031FA1DA2
MKLNNDQILLNLKNIWNKNSFLISILIGVLVGCILGICFRYAELSTDAVSILGYPGELFMRALKMIVLPFIICCIILGSATLNLKSNKFVAVRVIVFFFLTALLNASLGITLGLLFKPGRTDIAAGGIEKASTVQDTVSILDGLLDVGRNLISDNFFEATFQQTYTAYQVTKKNNTDGISSEIRKKVLKSRSGTNTLGIIFFCVLFGCILGTLERQKKILIEFFTAIYDVLQKMLLIVIWFTPLGVASIICSKIATVPNILATLEQVGVFTAICIGGLLFYQLVIAQLIYFLIVKKNPFKYYVSILSALMTGFATASKAASLPVMFKVLDGINMNKKITNFVLPIGTINLNGSAQFMGIAMVFLTQLEGRSLGVNDIITLIFSCTFASMSSAAIPSAAIVMVTMLCSVVNIPAENVALLLSVDWLIDRFRTATNVLGDCYTVAVVEQLSQKELKAEDNQDKDILPEEVVSVESTSEGRTDSPKSNTPSIA